MVKGKKINVVFCLLLIIWMAFIFIMSMQPAEQSSQLSGGIVTKLIAALFNNFNSLTLQQQGEITNVVTFVVRKTAHFSEYFILGIFASLAIKIYESKKHKLKFLFVFLFCVLYAVSDEVHQHFVPGRACRLLDVFIDATGILTALILMLIITHYLKKHKSGEKMRKKKLIEQNLSLFEDLQKAQAELKETKRLLSRNVDEINALKAELEKAKSQQTLQAEEKPTEPMHRLEEKVITTAAIKPDMEYGSKVIGKIVMSAAEYSNKLTLGGDDSKKELVNLILGKTEIAKSEILTVIESDDSFDVKCAKIDQISAVAKEYFESVLAQIV